MSRPGRCAWNQASRRVEWASRQAESEFFFLLMLSYCIPIRPRYMLLLVANRRREAMADKPDVWQGTLALMVLKTIEAMGPLHGYGIARRIERTSGDLLSVNYGTLYPALLKLEQEGYIASEWGVSDNNRRAKYYRLTRAGRKRLEKEAQEWEQATAIMARFLAPDSKT
jgi:PadR family transcriptional regulator, regulatory protein PadR